MAAAVSALVSREAQLANAMREASEAVLARKRQGGAPAAPDASRASALLMELRSASDLLVSRVCQQELGEQEARERVAGVEEQLRMLKYQRARLRRAIAECTQGAESQKKAVEATGVALDAAAAPKAGESTHQLALRRLGAECDERARLCVHRDALAARREALAAVQTSLAERKAAVDGQLEAVTSAAAPLQKPMPTPASSYERFTERSAKLLPLLPSPLYTIALGAAALMVSSGVEGTLDIEGNVEAAEALVSDAGKANGVFAHPLTLSLKLRAKKGTATVTFSYHPSLELLAAAASPAAADTALRRLASLLPSTSEGAVVPTGGAAAEDDGSSYPDLCACLRARRVEAPSSAQLGVAVEALLPSRPYKWLQARALSLDPTHAPLTSPDLPSLSLCLAVAWRPRPVAQRAASAFARGP